MIEKCKIIDLPEIYDDRGVLGFVEAGRHIPFDIRRVYYLHGVPEGSERGGHAHKELHQLLIAVSGGFDVVLDDGSSKKTLRLNSPSKGLYICPMIWREIKNFSPNSVCLVLASNYYSEEDYYRNYQLFLNDLL